MKLRKEQSFMLRFAWSLVCLVLSLTLGACGPGQEGDACAATADCAQGLWCHQEVCTDSVRSCVNDAECGGGEVCRRGACQPNISECEGAWDCRTGMVCSQGECRTPQVGNPCQRHQDCGAEMYCAKPRFECTELTGGRCWTRTACAEGQDCESIDDATGIGLCGGGGCDPACGGETPHCVGGRCMACVTDDHCPGEARCEANRCVGPAGACERNQDCPGETPVCQQGRCVECGTDRHCTGEQTCVDNRCQGGVSSECGYDGDCGVGQRCVERRCVDDPGGCRSDQDCPEDQRCRGGRCVTQQGGCVADGDCGANQACQNGQCVPRDQPGQRSYGETTAAASECASGFAGVWDNQVFCSIPCGQSQDCPLASMCTTMVGSATSYCVPSTRAGGPLSAPEGQACQSPTMCRSGVCANTQQGAFCQRDCTRDNHCGNAQSCMAMALDQNGTIARLCANAQGLAQNGSACAPGNHSCRSGICDNTTNQCQPLCCSAADCAPGLACNPTIIDQRGPVIVKVCGRAPGAGRQPVGAACQADADCLSSSCLDNRCSDTCCTDADCAGLRCKPHNVGTEQAPILVNLCKL